MAVLEAKRQSINTPFGGGLEEPEPYAAEDIEALLREYPDLRIELSSKGELSIMPPTMTKSGIRNARLTGRLMIWSDEAALGETFDSSTLFLLPNGALRSPDASWIQKARWEALTEEEKDDFAPICPDFVAELRSKSDRLSSLQSKLREYISCGAKLGWLIDPVIRRVEIYRPNQDVEVLDNPTSISGEPELLGFVLNLKGILD